MNDKKRLLAHVLNKPVSYLFAYPNPELTAKQQQHFDALSQRLDNGEPFAYLTGEREFWSLNFKVTPDVLIPRPETELLVEFLSSLQERDPGDAPTQERHPDDAKHPSGPIFHIMDTDAKLRLCQHDEKFKFPLSQYDKQTKLLDLGTGSGAIAISLKSEKPNWHITATDFSETALTVAKDNATRLLTSKACVSNPIQFIQSDWFKDIPTQKFDIIVSNPPYIEETDPHLQNEIRFEPITALTAGKDGLDDIRSIITESQEYLNNSGLLIMEHGYNQAPAVRKLLSNNGFTNVDSLKDLAGIERATFGFKA